MICTDVHSNGFFKYRKRWKTAAQQGKKPREERKNHTNNALKETPSLSIDVFYQLSLHFAALRYRWQVIRDLKKFFRRYGGTWQLQWASPGHRN